MKNLIRTLIAPALFAAASVMADEVTYLHTDVLGSPIAATDENGTLLWEERYEPYGERYYEPTAASGNKRSFTGHAEDAGGLVYMGARYYNPEIGRFYSVDPISVRATGGTSTNRYAYALSNPAGHVDPDGRDAVPIVFPDFPVGTPIGSLTFIGGHGGVLHIDPKTGYTRYYEYGRYGDVKGIVRVSEAKTLPNVVIGADGKATPESLERVLGSISARFGKGTRIEGAYIRDADFAKMEAYAKKRMSKNSDPNRTAYDITDYNCGVFLRDDLRAGGIDTNARWRPDSYMQDLQEKFPKIEFTPAPKK